MKPIIVEVPLLPGKRLPDQLSIYERIAERRGVPFSYLPMESIARGFLSGSFTRRVRVWVGEVPKSRRDKCGARTRKGTLCKATCVPNMGKCRMHGGLSTGPKTAEGRARIAESNRRRAEAKRFERETGQNFTGFRAD
jgi:hypothetical protein